MAINTAHALEFERPLLQLEKKIEELRSLSASGAVEMGAEIARLEKKARKLQEEKGAEPG